MTYAIDGRLGKGTAIVARYAVEELLKNQNDFDLTFLHYEKSDEKFYNHGVMEVIFPRFTFKYLNFRWFRQIYYFLTTKDHYDVILWFQPRMYPLFWLAPAKNLICWIHGAGDLGEENVKTRDLGRSMFNWSLKNYNSKLCLAFAGSEFARQDVINKYGFEDPKKVKVVHYGVDSFYYRRSEEEIKNIRQKFNLPENFLLNVARLNPGKNAFRVIRAFDKFATENPSETIHFVNIGDIGSEAEEIKKYISESKNKDRIHLVGGFLDRMTDLPAIYSAAYALVFPLLNEGFGLPIMEAMNCGTPTVVSNTCYPDITEKETILVDALSDDSVAEGIRKIVKDKALRQELIGNGYIFVRNFTWQKMGENIMNIFRDIDGIK